MINNPLSRKISLLLSYYFSKGKTSFEITYLEKILLLINQGEYNDEKLKKYLGFKTKVDLVTLLEFLKEMNVLDFSKNITKKGRILLAYKKERRMDFWRDLIISWPPISTFIAILHSYNKSVSLNQITEKWGKEMKKLTFLANKQGLNVSKAVMKPFNKYFTVRGLVKPLKQLNMIKYEDDLIEFTELGKQIAEISAIVSYIPTHMKTYLFNSIDFVFNLAEYQREKIEVLYELKKGEISYYEGDWNNLKNEIERNSNYYNFILQVKHDSFAFSRLKRGDGVVYWDPNSFPLNAHLVE